MIIQRDSVHFRILERLCRTPKAVRGTSGAMLERDYGAPRAIDELARGGLIKERGWHNGPGGIWIPTQDGMALYEQMAAAAASDGADTPDPADRGGDLRNRAG